MSFTCQYCYEDMLLGDFRFRLHRSKKMPKKSLKLYHNSSLQLQASSTFNANQSKYQKYVHRLSMPRNTMEIKCRNCSFATSMSTLKPKYVPPQPVVLKRNKKLKNPKTPQDLNAGLIIPSSMISSSLLQPQANRSSLFTNQETTPNSLVARKEFPSWFPKVGHEKRRKLKEEGKKNKEREVNQLRKALFKSKEMSSSGSASLNNFFDKSEIKD